jgi:hypothetical protein
LENYHQKITVSKGPYKKAIEEGTVEKGGWWIIFVSEGM